jgi:phage terminase small subunit
MKEPAKTKTAKETLLEPLTDKEEWLCREFVCDENQVRCYMRVYPGSSYDVARTTSSKVFAKGNIRQRIDALRVERNKRLEINADKVLEGLAKLAFSDSRNLFDSDGRLKPIHELDPDDAAVIGGIETFHKVVGEGDDGIAVITKIKIADRGQNLERLGRHLKLFSDVVVHEVSDSMAELMKSARERSNLQNTP